MLGPGALFMSHRAAASSNLRQIKNDCVDLVFFTSNAATKEPPASETMIDRKEFSSTGPVVVVVGDDLAIRNSLKFWLELEGLTVRSYASGAEFLAAGELSRCDCLVIDQSIPANGLHSIMQLRAQRFSAPAILVISQPSPSLRKEAEKAGVPIVEKPLLGNGLLDTIRDATRGRLG
jgi:two-component system, LuxR family, response regulator FixJ